MYELHALRMYWNAYSECLYDFSRFANEAKFWMSQFFSETQSLSLY